MSLLRSLTRLLDAPDAPSAHDPIGDAVRAHMPDAGDAAHRVVTAVTGLLACVAWADREYSDEERALVRDALGRMHGLEPAGSDAVAAVLEERIGEVAQGDHAWIRDLRELTDRDQRLELLELLVDLAAADGVIDHGEVTYLRRLAKQLGLSQREYNAFQAAHRDKLRVLSAHD